MLTQALVLLASLTPLATAPEVPALPLARVTAVAAMGTDLVIVAGETTYLVAAADVVLVGDCLTLTGSFTAMTVTPSVLEVEWTCTRGAQHKVKTDCTGLKREDCFLKHREMVELYQKHFPPVKTSMLRLLRPEPLRRVA